MDHQQPISGDLHAIQREHSNHSSTISSPPKSLLERRQDDQILDNNITPMPTGIDRMAALKDLGTTFEEGQRRISKVATPTETVVPSFVDSQHLESLMHQKHKMNLEDASKDVAKCDNNINT